MKLDFLLKLVDDTLNELYSKDRYLFDNNVREESIVTRFYYNFRKRLEDNGLNYDVDNEYNCDILNERGYKEIFYEGRYKEIIPDMIIHKRGTNDKNVVAIEFKKKWNYDKKSRKIDDYKLKVLTDLSLHYKYRYGLFIDFGKIRNKTIVKLYIDGKIVNQKDCL